MSKESLARRLACWKSVDGPASSGADSASVELLGTRRRWPRPELSGPGSSSLEVGIVRIIYIQVHESKTVRDGLGPSKRQGARMLARKGKRPRKRENNYCYIWNDAACRRSSASIRFSCTTLIWQRRLQRGVGKGTSSRAFSAAAA